MKKITTILAVLVIMISGTAFANTGDKVTKTVQAAFDHQFSGAEEISWEITADFYFATFSLDKKSMTAAFNEDGELVGISRKLLFSEIPLNVSQSVKNSFTGYTIRDSVTEIMYDGQTFYYVTACNQNKTLKLKCFSDGEITIEKKIKK